MVLAIIPARYESARLPGKVLADIGGKSMLQRTVEQVRKAPGIHKIIVATDHADVMAHCEIIKVESILTDQNHQSGTDRIAEVASKVDCDYVINVQADEPFIEPEIIKSLINTLKSKNTEIATLARILDDVDVLFDFNQVKLTMNNEGKALYFSRQAIPAQRDIPFREWMNGATPYYGHIGIYGFAKETLLEITKLSEGDLEKVEKLEQLRWLENGYDIQVAIVNAHSSGIDTQEDLDKARKAVSDDHT